MFTPTGQWISGKITALRGGIHLMDGDRAHIIRNLIEITFDQEADRSLSDLWESLLGGVVMIIDRNKPGSLFDVAGLVLATSGNKAIAIPLADFTVSQGLTVLCPPEWEPLLFPTTAHAVSPTANSQSLRTMDFVLDVLRSNETIEDESKNRIFRLTEIKFSEALEEV